MRFLLKPFFISRFSSIIIIIIIIINKGIVQKMLIEGTSDFRAKNNYFII